MPVDFSRLIVIAVGIIVGAMFLALCVIIIGHGELWFRAYMSGADVSFRDLLGRDVLEEVRSRVPSDHATP